MKNLFALDGFLDSIPLPDNSADVLMTSNAIGWNLEDELSEIERILKSSGCAIHLFQDPDIKAGNPIHDVLISSEWEYTCCQYRYAAGWKVKYLKAMETDR